MNGNNPFPAKRKNNKMVESMMTTKTSSAALPTTGYIKILVKANPKRPGTASYARFELYRDGMTREQFLKAGGKGVDLQWDLAHGHIAFQTNKKKPVKKPIKETPVEPIPDDGDHPLVAMGLDPEEQALVN